MSLQKNNVSINGEPAGPIEGLPNNSPGLTPDHIPAKAIAGDTASRKIEDIEN